MIKQQTGNESASQDAAAGRMNSENGGEVRSAGGGKSDYAQSPGGNNVEAPMGDEDRDGGESTEKARGSRDWEAQQKAKQQRRGGASGDFDSNVSGASGSSNARTDKAATHRGPQPSSGNRDSEDEGKDRLTNEGGPPPAGGAARGAPADKETRRYADKPNHGTSTTEP